MGIERRCVAARAKKRTLTRQEFVILNATAVGIAAITPFYPPNGKCTSDKFFQRYDSIAAATHNSCRRLIFIASRMDRYHSLCRRHPGGCHLNKKKMSSAVSGFHTPAGKETMPNLNINGRNLSVEAANDTPLLWVIREQLQMTGTKFGCGAGLCGACTVHINGEAVRSCQTQVSDAVGKKITTIEGLSRQGRPSPAEGVDRRAGPAMRLLPVRPDHAGSLAAGEKFQPDQG